MPAPIATSLHRLADARVLIAVQPTATGPVPLSLELAGELTFLAWTDRDEAETALRPDGALVEIGVAEFLSQLPAYVGLLVDPASPSPVYVPAIDRPAVLEAAGPFPVGASVTLGVPPAEPDRLLELLATRACLVERLDRMWHCWYRVADAREKLLVVLDVGDAAAGAAAGLVMAVAAEAEYGRPVLALPLTAVPAQQRDWLLAHVQPFFRRPAVAEPGGRAVAALHSTR